LVMAGVAGVASSSTRTSESSKAPQTSSVTQSDPALLVCNSADCDASCKARGYSSGECLPGCMCFP
jgi:hypothetical protein